MLAEIPIVYYLKQASFQSYSNAVIFFCSETRKISFYNFAYRRLIVFQIMCGETVSIEAFVSAFFSLILWIIAFYFYMNNGINWKVYFYICLYITG